MEPELELSTPPTGFQADSTVSPEPVVSLLIHWKSLSDGMLLSLVISGPSLFAALLLRDQRAKAWPFLLVISALGFALGGATAGRHRRMRRGAIIQGVVLGLMIATVSLVGNIIRTLVLVKAVSASTAGLWVGVEVGALLFASVGALFGRRRYRRAMKRRSGR